MQISEIKQLATVDGWVDFMAEVTEVKETKSRTKKNKLMAKVRLKDETDEIGAWLYVDGQQFWPGQVVVANGMLKEYKDVRYLDYATVKSVKEGTPQAPQKPAGKPNSKQDVWDAKDKRMARMSGLKDAAMVLCAIAEANKDFAAYLTREKVTEMSEYFVNYIYNGTNSQPPEEDMNTYEEAKAAHESEQGSDIPF